MLALLVVLAAMGAVTFETPARAAASFVLAALGTGALLHMSGAVEVAGILLWLVGAGVGLLLLTTILVLNLSPEEVGRRRFSVTRTIALFVVAWVAAAIFALQTEIASSPWALAPQSSFVEGDALGVAVFERWGIGLALGFTALGASGVAALLLARRRS